MNSATAKLLPYWPFKSSSEVFKLPTDCSKTFEGKMASSSLQLDYDPVDPREPLIFKPQSAGVLPKGSKIFSIFTNELSFSVSEEIDLYFLNLSRTLYLRISGVYFYWWKPRNDSFMTRQFERAFLLLFMIHKNQILLLEKQVRFHWCVWWSGFSMNSRMNNNEILWNFILKSPEKMSAKELLEKEYELAERCHKKRKGSKWDCTI